MPACLADTVDGLHLLPALLEVSMILFIGLWHTLTLIGVVGCILAVPAFLAVARLWTLWVGIGSDIQQAEEQYEQEQREKRSAAGVKGWQTRKAKREITPDDAFVQRGEEQ